jgi:peptide/nickel transport system permease protein
MATTATSASDLTVVESGPRLGPWPRFILRRAIGLVGVLATLLLITFMLIHLVPGDPAVRAAGVEATEEHIEFLREDLGLNRPIPEQFINYVERVARLDFGNSFITKEPVSKIIADRFPKTAQLAAVALALVLIISIPFGIIAGAITREGRNQRFEMVFMAVTGVGGAVPEFLTGTLLAFFFAVILRWLPVGGANKPESIILPALAISIRSVALYSRIVRLETLNVLAQDYIRTARSKRLPPYLLYLRHILPNVLTSALTIGGLLFAGLLGGTVIVENVFAWPGLGTQVVKAVLSLDYPVIQGAVLYFGLIVVLINTIVDVLLVVVDPRSLVE